MLAATTAYAAPIYQTYGVFDIAFYNNGDTDGYSTSGQNWTASQMADVGVFFSGFFPFLR
ncbi:MAG: hypothetical protein ACYSSI_11375 [Planctomycetota bacterium]